MKMKRNLELLLHTKRGALNYLIEEKNREERFLETLDVEEGMELWFSGYAEDLVSTVITGGSEQERLALEITGLKRAASEGRPVLILHHHNTRMLNWLDRWGEGQVYRSGKERLCLLTPENENDFLFRLAKLYKEMNGNESGRFYSYLKTMWELNRKTGAKASLQELFDLSPEQFWDMEDAMPSYEQLSLFKEEADFCLKCWKEEFSLFLPNQTGLTPEEILRKNGICCVDLSGGSNEVLEEYFLLLAEEIARERSKACGDCPLLLVMDGISMGRESGCLKRFIKSEAFPAVLMYTSEDLVRIAGNEENLRTVLSRGKMLAVLSHESGSAEVLEKMLGEYYHIHINVNQEGSKTAGHFLTNGETNGFTVSEERRMRITSQDITELKEQPGTALVSITGSRELYRIRLLNPNRQ